MGKNIAMNENDMSNGSNGGNGNSDDNVTRPGNKGNEPIYTVWHGYDVVLTDNLPSETKPVRDPKSKVPYGDQTRQSWRRRSTGEQDDYGWLRQLDLRSDIPAIEEILDWSFDVLEFEDTVLVSVFIKMLEYYNLLEKFNLDRETLERYGRKVMEMHHKDCYYQKVDLDQTDGNSNSGEGKEEERKPEILCEYHNWYHAVSCAHSSFLFLKLGGADAFLYPIELFCIIMGGLIHDLDHPGTNNDFEVKRSTQLAKLYNNDAVLERHSINTGLNMCQENPDLDWLNLFEDDKDREYVKHFLAESVLATDPARHGNIIKEALVFVGKGPQDYQSISTSDDVKSDSEPSSLPSPLTYFNKDDPQHRIFIGGLILHSADISNPLHSSFEVASDWAVRVTTEFTRQANKEKQLELPVTTFMDGIDSEVKIATVQIGFFNFMVKPLFHNIGILFPALNMLEEWGQRNCVEYQLVIDQLEIQQKLDAITVNQKDDSKEDGSASNTEQQKDDAPETGGGGTNSVETQTVVDEHEAGKPTYGSTCKGEAPF